MKANRLVFLPQPKYLCIHLQDFIKSRRIKVIRNGQVINVWPESGGRLRLPDYCDKAEVIAFAAEENEFRFDEHKAGPSKRAQPTFPRMGQIRNFSADCHTSLFSKGKGKRPAPGYSFIAEKKPKSITKNIALSDLGADGSLYELFPIIINRNPKSVWRNQCGHRKASR